MMKTRSISRLIVLLGLMLATVFAQAQTTASGTLNAKLVNKSGIWIVFNTDASGVTLGNAGTSAASLNFGNVAMYMTTPPAGVALTRTATNFTVGTPFDVYVGIGGTTSTSYRLQASVQTAPGVYTFKVDSITLTTTAATVAAADPNYGANVQHTMYLTVPATAPAGAVSNTVNFTVTAN
ncbi:MAG: hypothetical protein ACRD3E_12295 [Terriglobales bacterium]